MILPLSVGALLLTLISVPESKDPAGRKLDLPGQVLAIVGLGALSLAFIEGPRWGWAWAGTIAALVTATIAAGWFLVRQANVDGALVPLPMFRNRAFSASLGVAAAMTFGIYAMLFLLPLYLQSVRGASALTAGIELLPMSVTFVVVSQLSGRIANAFGPRVPMTAGMAMIGTGILILAFIAIEDSLVLIETALLIIGCGLGLNTAPVNAVVVANAPTARSGIASGLVNTARMVGATLGVAVLGAVFAVFAGDGAAPRIVAGLGPAFIGGGLVEMLGAATAFLLVRHDSLRQTATAPASAE